MTHDDRRGGHGHAGFEPPAGYRDPAGRPVDYALLGRFTGAAFDGCTTCQDALLTLLAEDAATCARLVELACVSVHATAGGLPAGLTNDRAPGPAAPEFRRLARAGAGGANDAMFAECARMSSAERRAAANTAADLIVGDLIRYVYVNRGLGPGGGARRHGPPHRRHRR